MWEPCLEISWIFMQKFTKQVILGVKLQFVLSVADADKRSNQWTTEKPWSFDHSHNHLAGNKIILSFLRWHRTELFQNHWDIFQSMYFIMGFTIFVWGYILHLWQYRIQHIEIAFVGADVW